MIVVLQPSTKFLKGDSIGGSSSAKVGKRAEVKEEIRKGGRESRREVS